MSNLLRCRALWNGFSGAPGYTNWYYDYSAGTPADATQALRTMYDFFNVLKASLPTDVIVSFPLDLAIMDSSSGQQTSQVTAGAMPGEITGTGAGSYSAPSGAVIRWTTGAYKNGRQVRGRTFLVPLVASAYDGDGTLGSGTVTTLQTAATGSVSTGGLPRVVFSRPAAGGGSGSFAVITGGFAVDKACVLRSRRD